MERCLAVRKFEPQVIGEILQKRAGRSWSRAGRRSRRRCPLAIAVRR
jgi:hypothetical protein